MYRMAPILVQLSWFRFVSWKGRNIHTPLVSSFGNSIAGTADRKICQTNMILPDHKWHYQVSKPRECISSSHDQEEMCIQSCSNHSCSLIDMGPEAWWLLSVGISELWDNSVKNCVVFFLPSGRILSWRCWGPSPVHIPLARVGPVDHGAPIARQPY